MEQPFAVTGAEGKPGSGNRCGFIQHVNSVIDPSLGPAVTLAPLAFPKCEGTGWHGSCAELETCVCVSHGLYHFQPRRVLYWQNTRTPVIALFIDLQLENRPWIIVITHYYCLYYCAHPILVWFCISNACLSVFMCSYGLQTVEELSRPNVRYTPNLLSACVSSSGHCCCCPFHVCIIV